MQNRPNAAERLRPFIQAMERCIDQARSRRVVGGRPNFAPSTGRQPQVAEQVTAPAGEPIRVKARPKRDLIRP